jgi:DNA primase
MSAEELQALLENLGFQQIRTRHGNLSALCPFHTESRPSWGISTEPPHFHHCFSCGASGALSSLLQQKFSYTREEAARISGVDELDVKFQPLEREQALLEQVDYRLLFPFLDFKTYAPAYKYLRSRGLKDEVCQQAGLLFDPMHQRAIFPWRLNGLLYAVTGRSIDPLERVKTLPYFASRKGQCFYLPAGKFSAKSEFVILCEGEIDSLRIMQAGYPNVGALGFGTITKEAVRRAKEHMPNLKEIVAFFDDDATGRLLAKRLETLFQGYIVSGVDYTLVRKSFAYTSEQKLDPAMLLTRHIRVLVEGRKQTAAWPEF